MKTIVLYNNVLLRSWRKNSSMKFISLFIFLSSFFSKAQVLNIDREYGTDSIQNTIAGVIDFSFSADKQRRDIIELTQQSELDILMPKSHILIALAHTDIVFNGPTVLENNGYFQLRYRDNDSKKIAPDFYLQYQWNGIWGLENRALFGCNARFRFWDDRNDDLYAGLGMFYEYEKWNPFLENYAFGGVNLQEIERNLLRLNLTLKTAFKVTHDIDFSAISYLQSPINSSFQNILNPRWFVDAQINFTINKHLNFNIRYNQNLDYFRPLPIDVFFYSLLVGGKILF